MPIATCALIAAGCASSRPHGTGDADPGPADASAPADTDARELRVPDARAIDSAPDGAPDAAPDAGCMISASAAPALDGNGDLAKYAPAQVTTPGAAMSGSDAVAITWDRTDLYVTATSDGFLGDYKPLHIYIEEGAGPLPAASPTTGKEYGGLTPQLSFTPTHLIAVRRVSDAGTGPYDGVFTPGTAPLWTTRTTALALGTDVFASSDHRTVSARVPWTALGGCPTALRLAVHVVNGVAANEWKDLLPATATPWLAPGGGYFEIDLTQPPPMSGWALH